MSTLPKKKKKKKNIKFYLGDFLNQPGIPDISHKKAAQTFSVHFFTMNSSIRSPNVPIFLSETSKSNPLNPSTPLPLISKISQMAAKNPGIGLSVTLPRSMQKGLWLIQKVRSIGVYLFAISQNFEKSFKGLPKVLWSSDLEF